MRKIQNFTNRKFICISLCILSIASCKNPSLEIPSTHIFRYAHEQANGTIRSESMRFFEHQLEKRSEGKLLVETYFGGILGNERELMDLVATGALQGTRGGFYADASPAFNLITLPFLVDDWEQALRLVNSTLMEEINESAKKNGFHIPVTGIALGFRAHTNSVKPITHPTDLSGLKMRVPMQEVFVQTAMAFGSNPQEMNYIDVYQALQTGVVDGQDTPPANIWDFKIYEVNTYLTITNYATGPDPLFVNLNWYKKLPVDLQQIFNEVSREAMALSDRLQRESELDFINKLSDHLEVNYVTGKELEPFREAVKPVYQYFLDKGDFTQEQLERARKISRGKND